VLAPNAPLRAAVTALALATATTPPPATNPQLAAKPAQRRAVRYAWARRLARIYEVSPLVCPLCGADMRIIAFITDPSTIRDILVHLGEPTAPPRIARARGPPLGGPGRCRAGHLRPEAQPAPEYEFDQRIAWLTRSSTARHARRWPGPVGSFDAWEAERTACPDAITDR
jgi:hypothetical protein